MKPVKKTIVLPADIYDGLELSALAFGGIGAGQYEQKEIPFCVHGHAAEVIEHENGERWTNPHSIINRQLGTLGITFPVNDDAVDAVNARKRGAPCRARISFAEWCAELHVVRGEG